MLKLLVWTLDYAVVLAWTRVVALILSPTACPSSLAGTHDLGIGTASPQMAWGQVVLGQVGGGAWRATGGAEGSWVLPVCSFAGSVCGLGGRPGSGEERSSASTTPIKVPKRRALPPMRSPPTSGPRFAQSRREGLARLALSSLVIANRGELGQPERPPTPQPR